MDKILKSENLTKKFGSLRAVNDVSFSIGNGELVGIAGPNGAGKTTLLNILSGFLKYEGTITFKDVIIDNLRPEKRCKEGLVKFWQKSMYFHSLNIFETFQVAKKFGSTDNQIDLHELCDLFGFRKKRETRFEELNAFEKKKARLACALATDPDLVLMDEPFAGLNYAEIEPLIEIIQKIKEDYDLTLIVVEHLLTILVNLSERLIILHEGEIIGNGVPKKVIGEGKIKDVYVGRGEF